MLFRITRPGGIKKTCHVLLYHDHFYILKTNPMIFSKRVFKEASGRLYRQRKIILNKSELTLV